MPDRTNLAHAVLAVVLQVRDDRLEALLWRRARAPFEGAWALPGGPLEPAETLEGSIRRQLDEKVDVHGLAHLEQLETHGVGSALVTAYLGLVPTGVDPEVPPDTAWHPLDSLPELAFDHGEIVFAGRARLRAKLSYTNAGFALAPETFTISELRDVYRAALGHDVSATNLQRVLLRRGVLRRTGEHRGPGRSGGRPAAVFCFRSHSLEITDQFAVLRPPGP